jgi:hypothetical protein
MALRNRGMVINRDNHGFPQERKQLTERGTLTDTLEPSIETFQLLWSSVSLQLAITKDWEKSGKSNPRHTQLKSQEYQGNDREARYCISPVCH